jgi:hypothetical protein
MKKEKQIPFEKVQHAGQSIFYLFVKHFGLKELCLLAVLNMIERFLFKSFSCSFFLCGFFVDLCWILYPQPNTTSAISPSRDHPQSNFNSLLDRLDFTSAKHHSQTHTHRRPPARPNESVICHSAIHFTSDSAFLSRRDRFATSTSSSQFLQKSTINNQFSDKTSAPTIVFPTLCHKHALPLQPAVSIASPQIITRAKTKHSSEGAAQTGQNASKNENVEVEEIRESTSTTDRQEELAHARNERNGTRRHRNR